VALVDMKVEKKQEYKEEELEQLKYPYGLRLELDNEQLEKLGVKELPTVGDEKKMFALVEVVSVHVSSTIAGGDDRSVCLQIKSMAFQEAEKKEKSVEEKFFGDKG